MTQQPVVIYVIYRGTAESRFDSAYYVAHHLPLVMKAWGPYGLESARAFFPTHAQDGTIALCECRFQSEAALAAAFSASETPAVMADVAVFTDLTPERARLSAM